MKIMKATLKRKKTNIQFLELIRRQYEDSAGELVAI